MYQDALQTWLNRNGEPSESANDEYTPNSHADKNTYEIVSKTGYLLGVPKRIFEHEFEPLQIEEYKKLELNKNARIVRNLCLLRTSIIRNFGPINKEMRHNYRSITSLTELVPQDAIMALSNDGIKLFTNKKAKLVDHLIELNRHISDRINNCKSLFPTWLAFDYLKSLFVTPDGLTENGTKVASERYYANRNWYPYQIFMNWTAHDCGNFFYNDNKFISILYELNCDEFVDHNKVTDVGDFSKNKVLEFLDEAYNIVMVVDCENSDVYNLCSALNGFDEDALSKISKIILYDDVHTCTAWDMLQGYTDIPVEHITVDRVKNDKSLVDIKLIMGVTKEHYLNKVDTFLIVSSDSDYWGLISELPEASFLVMVEHTKCGPDLKNALSECGIFYCYIDDFYAASGTELQTAALYREMNNYLKEHLNLNLRDMLDTALTATRFPMSAAERNQFYDRHLRTMQMRIDETGQVLLEFKNK